MNRGWQMVDFLGFDLRFLEEVAFHHGPGAGKKEFSSQIEKNLGRLSTVVLCPFAGLKRDWLAIRLEVDPVTGESAPMT
ncbi:MAG: hypothetical protein EHM49_10080 [Deltaproteobacteria bacterium]|nr:MAG: hypothetical protein EHM49_10080 [Deltaproteobacteria bacterium]